MKETGFAGTRPFEEFFGAERNGSIGTRRFSDHPVVTDDAGVARIWNAREHPLDDTIGRHIGGRVDIFEGLNFVRMLDLQAILTTVEHEGDMHTFGIVNTTYRLGQLIAGGIEINPA